MERQRRPLLLDRQQGAELSERPDLWLLKVAVRPETCPMCGERIEPGEAEAWHVPSTLYFHQDCASLAMGRVTSHPAD